MNVAILGIDEACERGRAAMDPQTQSRIEDRIREISRELGLLEASDLAFGRAAPPEHDLVEVGELYAERERLMQELEKDC